MPALPDHLEKIIALRERGQSYEHIAHYLNRVSLGTPTQGKKWTPTYVAMCLNKHRDSEDGFFQQENPPAQVEDIYPFELPIGEDFYCRLEPAPRRAVTAGRDRTLDFSHVRRGRPPKAGRQAGYR